MRAKSLLLLMIALGCGMVAAVAVSKTLMERDSKPAGEASIEILVATREIKTAGQITVDKVKLEKWPKSRIPEGSITNLSAVEGKFARQGIFPGEPILIPKIADSNNSLSTQIPAGHTLFNISFDNNYIKPGDIVDISGVFNIARNKTPEVRTVLRDVQVFAINGNSNRDIENKGGKGTIFQLLIKQNQHQALLLASNIGKLELNLRPLGGDGEVKGIADDGESFLTWARENNADPEAEEVVNALPPLTTLVQAPVVAEPAVKPSNKHEILVVTPHGITRYEYVGNELPREVKAEVDQRPSNYPSNYPGNPWGSSSGYGGYAPTYPTASASTPGTTSSAAPSSGEAAASGNTAAEPTAAPGRKSMFD